MTNEWIWNIRHWDIGHSVLVIPYSLFCIC
jgi:hypothetical protein